MKRSSSSNPSHPQIPRMRWKQTLGALLVAGYCGHAAADYQQTLAAKGTDAYPVSNSPVAIEQEDIQRVFLQDAESGNQAISDQDIMMALQARMSAENQLAEAAKNLDPTVPESDALASGLPGTAQTGISPEEDAKPGGVIAAR